MGQSVIAMETMGVFLPWQYQPVHNVFLLIWSELGIIGLALFIWILEVVFSVKAAVSRPPATKALRAGGTVGQKKIKEYLGRDLLLFRGILLGFLFVALFDHYLWDIQQGQILLWLTMGMIAGLSSPIDK